MARHDAPPRRHRLDRGLELLRDQLLRAAIRGEPEVAFDLEPPPPRPAPPPAAGMTAAEVLAFLDAEVFAAPIPAYRLDRLEGDARG